MNSTLVPSDIFYPKITTLCLVSLSITLSGNGKIYVIQQVNRCLCALSNPEAL